MLAATPSSFYPELTDERLREIAVPLLDMRYTTLREMHSPFDDNYTRETAVFGRSKNMLIEMAHSGVHPWMTLSNASMDVTFNIGRVPCRFFRDDPDSPEKAGFFRRNSVDSLFENDQNAPVMWRFVVDKAMTEEDEDRVHFVGYNLFQEKVAEWMYRPSMPTLHAVDRDVPAAATILPAVVELREDVESQDNSRQAGNDK